MSWLRSLSLATTFALLVTVAPHSLAGPTRAAPREAPARTERTERAERAERHEPATQHRDRIERGRVERRPIERAHGAPAEAPAARRVERAAERKDGRLEREPKLVVFDWDGTIGDTYPQLRWITERAAIDAGVAPSPKAGEDPYRSVIDGAGLEVMFRRLAPNGTHEQERLFLEKFQVHSKAAPKELVRAKPGVLDDLRAFRAAHRNIKLAILSSRPQPIVEEFARVAGVSELFDKIVGTGGSKIPEKPSPEGLHVIARALGVDPKEGVMIGDTPMDVGAGHAAGMHTVALKDGMGTSEKLSEARPHVLLDRLPGWAERVLPPAPRIGGAAPNSFVAPTPPAARSPEVGIHTSLGLPQSLGENVHVLPRRGFVSIYDSEKKVPLLVSWSTSKAMLGDDPTAFNERRDVFHADPHFEGPQASLRDFHKSGYDRGHLVRQGERPLRLDREGNESTFSLVNIVPQTSENNSGPWKHFENYYRDIVFEKGSTAHVLAGTLFEGPEKTIGNGVRVPSHLYKIVVLTKPNLDVDRMQPEQIGSSVEVVAVLVPNDNASIRWTDHFGKYVVPISEIEHRSGLELLTRLPAATRAAVRAHTPSVRADRVAGREGMFVGGHWVPNMWPSGDVLRGKSTGVAQSVN